MLVSFLSRAGRETESGVPQDQLLSHLTGLDVAAFCFCVCPRPGLSAPRRQPGLRCLYTPVLLSRAQHRAWHTTCALAQRPSKGVGDGTAVVPHGPSHGRLVSPVTHLCPHLPSASRCPCVTPRCRVPQSLCGPHTCTHQHRERDIRWLCPRRGSWQLDP